MSVERHTQATVVLGLGTCADHTDSRDDCERAGCAYRPASYAQWAVCYDPRTETPGTFWGITRKAPSADVYEQAYGLAAQRLARLEAFPGKGREQVRLAESQQNPQPFTPEQEEIIAAMRATAEAVYKDISSGGKAAFDKPDATVSTIDADGRNIVLTLTPGDHIYRAGAFGLRSVQHHGVYIGRQFVIEVGPSNFPAVSGIHDVVCALVPGVQSAKGVVGVSTLHEFNKPNTEVGRIDYPPASRKSRADAVRDAIRLIGAWNYKLTRSNCEHLATYIVTGTFDSQQIEAMSGPVRAVVLKPLGKVWRWLYSSNVQRYTATPTCTLFVGSDQCPDRTHVAIACDDTVSCHPKRALQRELREQRRRGEPAHDPTTGKLLSAAQVRVILQTAN